MESKGKNIEVVMSICGAEGQTRSDLLLHRDLVVAFAQIDFTEKVCLAELREELCGIGQWFCLKLRHCIESSEVYTQPVFSTWLP